MIEGDKGLVVDVSVDNVGPEQVELKFVPCMVKPKDLSLYWTEVLPGWFCRDAPNSHNFEIIVSYGPRGVVLEKDYSHPNSLCHISKDPSFQFGIELMQHRLLAEDNPSREKLLVCVWVPDESGAGLAGERALFGQDQVKGGGGKGPQGSTQSQPRL